VVLHDDRAQRINLDTSFGTLLQNAADVTVHPSIRVWIQPPPPSAALAGLKPVPERPDVELVVHHGRIERH